MNVLKKMTRANKVLAGTVLFASLMTTSHAVECVDPVLTQAITQAMERAPKAGECNVKLYGKADSHEERVAVVKEVLTRIYAAQGSTDGTATQKLPLKNLTHD